MKILLLNWRDVTHPKSGGAEKVTMEHLKRWVEFGHDVTFFTAGYSGAKTEENRDGVKIIRRGGSLTVYPCAAYYLLRNSGKYDVVVDEIHAFPFFSNFVFRTPVVAFIHEIAGEIWDYMWIPPFNFLGKFLEPIFLHIYGMRKIPFWTDAPSMKKELEAYGIPSNQITTIPCPLIYDIPKKRYPKNEKFTFIFLNRIVPMKGISDVLKAFSIIQKKHNNVELWIVGSGESKYISSLKQETERLHIAQHIRWWGKVTEEKKYELLSRAHILLHASVKEGWGLVVLEAAAVGTPSVVYPVSGLVDVVKHNKTGIVAQDVTPEALSKASMDLLSNTELYKRFQEEGKKWVDSLSWEEVAKQSISLLLATQKQNHDSTV